MIGIWGIVNATPDSFSDGGRHADPESAIAHGRRLLADGATVLDIGGESTRPGSQRISAEEEQARILDVIAALAADAPISVDTLNASTATAAIAVGAHYINDVSGGLVDPDMLAAVAATDAEYVIGHWRGPSADMYAGASYGHAPREVAAELAARRDAAVAAGIAPERIVLDPGLGFAKAGAQNWDVLRGLDDILALGARVLIGTSRKGFLRETLAAASVREEKTPGEDRVPGAGSSGSDFSSAAAPAAASEVTQERRDLATAVTSVLAARAGAWAVRVHDVAATRDALAILDAWGGADV